MKLLVSKHKNDLIYYNNFLIFLILIIIIYFKYYNLYQFSKI